MRRLFGRGRDEHVEEDRPDNDGKLTASITITDIGRNVRTVYVVAIEQTTEDTIFRLNYTDYTATGKYSAYEKAKELLYHFVEKEGYIIEPADIIDNLSQREKPYFEMSDKRAR